ncbi:MAG TPA: hypothetical protein VJ867_01040, partial [Gemmatimonadaceae bacterium]|nr:hypothetical protein [Gemmatimonadaceae bacterium]
VRQSMDPTQSAEFLSDVARLTARVASNGFHFALARVLLHCAAPGIPDVYQGDELWNFALVDPDNRRPVDFARRRQLLAQIDRGDALGRVFTNPAADLDDAVKLALVARLLRFRREHRSLFLDGGYEPLSLVAPPADLGIFAFVRRTRSEACIALARTRPVAEGLADTMQQSQPVSAALAGRWRSVLSDRVVELRRSRAGLTVDVGSLIPATQPCELLFFDGR